MDIKNEGLSKKSDLDFTGFFGPALRSLLLQKRGTVYCARRKTGFVMEC